jgi:hypothetical protein
MFAHPLTRFEAAEMNASPEILARVRRSYELMLDFYGMRLLNTETGLVGRKDDGWEAQYQNLMCELYFVGLTFSDYIYTRCLRCFPQLSSYYPHPQILIDRVAPPLCSTFCFARIV